MNQGGQASEVGGESQGQCHHVVFNDAPMFWFLLQGLMGVALLL